LRPLNREGMQQFPFRQRTLLASPFGDLYLAKAPPEAFWGCVTKIFYRTSVAVLLPIMAILVV